MAFVLAHQNKNMNRLFALLMLFFLSAPLLAQTGEDDPKKKKGEVEKMHLLDALDFLKEKGHVKKGDKLIVLHGDIWSVEGGTSTVKVITCI